MIYKSFLRQIKNYNSGSRILRKMAWDTLEVFWREDRGKRFREFVEEMGADYEKQCQKSKLKI